MSIKVDIWSDIACPWCFLGKRRLEAAVREFDGPVEVEFHSFLLSPATLAEVPGSHAEFLAEHLGVSVERAREMGEHMTGLGATVGIAFDYDAIQTTNPSLAHQLIHWAKQQGRQAEMVEHLSSAYFEKGRHVGRIAELADLAAELGFDRDEAVDVLASGRHAADVEADIATARRLGINGVPFFVIDGTIGVSGAQEPAVLVDALERAQVARGLRL